MDSDWSNDYRSWMRERFPVLNESLDVAISEQALSLFAEEILKIARTIASDQMGDVRERYTYITMIHSAAYHHQKHAMEFSISVPAQFNSMLDAIERDMIQMANEIGVEHRFLSVFYLFCNPEIPDMNGKFVQFRPKEYETAFIRINREGTLQYKIGANALWGAYQLLVKPHPPFAPINSFLEQAAEAFRKISFGNSMLLRTPGGEEFRYITQYFGEVCVAGGPPLRGVNAGDQPWPYIIDLLLGVDLRRVFTHSYKGTATERNFESHSNVDVVRHEFIAGGYLHANYLLPEDYAVLENVLSLLDRSNKTLLDAIREPFPRSEQLELARTLHDITKYYLAASNVHYQLARRHVPKNAEGEQIGSAGTNIVTFLKEGLNAERERVKQNIELHYSEIAHAPQQENTIA